MSGLIMLEFDCPHHGRFEELVQRGDDGSTPDERPCQAWNGSGSELLDSRGWPSDKPCGAPSPWVISAPRIKHPVVLSAVRGKSDPPPSPYYLNTEALADGMPAHEFDAKRKALWEDHRRKEIKKAVA